MAKRTKKYGTKEDIWGQPDSHGMYPDAARQRIEMCERFGMEPDPEDVECVRRNREA